MESSTTSRLRELRLRADLTQEQLAVAAGVTAKTVASVERGANAHNGTLLLLATALGCSVEALTDSEEAAAA